MLVVARRFNFTYYIDVPREILRKLADFFFSSPRYVLLRAEAKTLAVTNPKLLESGPRVSSAVVLQDFLRRSAGNRLEPVETTAIPAAVSPSIWCAGVGVLVQAV